MDPHGWIALATLVVAAACFVTKPVPIAVTALSIPVVLVVTGTLEGTQDALAGFGNHAVIAIGSIFVVSGGLQESGVASLLARGLQRAAGRREIVLVLAVMAATAFLSAWMNNAAAVALLLPTGVALSRRTMIPASRLLMPMAIAAVLGGTTTMIGTAPNLLVADQLHRLTGESIGVFDFAVVGLPIVLTGMAWTAIVGRRLLPFRSAEDRLREAALPEEVAQSYGIDKNLFLMRVVPASGIAGKTLGETALRSRYGVSVVMVVRPTAFGGKRWVEPRPTLRFEPEDCLYVEADDLAAWSLADTELLQLGLVGPQGIEKMLGRGMGIAEVTIPPRSAVIGRSLRDLEFRKRHGLNVLSLWRYGRPTRTDMNTTALDVGDAFLVAGSARNIQDLAKDPEFLVLTDTSTVEDVRRAPLAVGLLLVAVLPAVLGWLPISISALAAALLMVVTGSISPSGLRHALDFNVLALVVGTIPLGRALEQHGVATRAAEALLAGASPLGTPAVLAALFVLAAVVAMLSTNAAAAVIVAPVAAGAAAEAGLDPRTALLAVAYGCSCAFVLPFAQWNLLVMTPGGYRARDYLRVGAGVSVVMAATAIVALSLL